MLKRLHWPVVQEMVNVQQGCQVRVLEPTTVISNGPPQEVCNVCVEVTTGVRDKTAGVAQKEPVLLLEVELGPEP